MSLKCILMYRLVVVYSFLWALESRFGVLSDDTNTAYQKFISSYVFLSYLCIFIVSLGFWHVAFYMSRYWQAKYFKIICRITCNSSLLFLTVSGRFHWICSNVQKIGKAFLFIMAIGEYSLTLSQKFLCFRTHYCVNQKRVNTLS